MKLKKRIVIAILLSLPYTGIGQETAVKHEIELGTDNDKFIIYTSTDRNYTYGINTAFRWGQQPETFFGSWFPVNQGNYLKVGLNIKAFTPEYLDQSEENSEVGQRPFAGWSYATFKTAYIFKKSYLRLGMEAGILGPGSQAGIIQNWFHKNISDDASVDWTGQIPNQLGINFIGSYGHEFYKQSWFDIYGKVDASLGNIFTYVWPQLNLRIGKFNDITKSVNTQNAIFNSVSNTEVFLDYGLGMKLSAYNATVQGALFNPDNRFSGNPVNHSVFTMHLGLNVSVNRFSIMGRYYYSTGEFERTQIHRYGAIRLLYRY